jgi:hypothetical protein
MLESPLGLGGEMTQTLYAHMNKRKKSFGLLIGASVNGHD